VPCAGDEGESEDHFSGIDPLTFFSRPFAFFPPVWMSVFLSSWASLRSESRLTPFILDSLVSSLLLGFALPFLSFQHFFFVTVYVALSIAFRFLIMENVPILLCICARFFPLFSPLSQAYRAHHFPSCSASTKCLPAPSKWTTINSFRHREPA
jgi:hypothetical protein